MGTSKGRGTTGRGALPLGERNVYWERTALRGEGCVSLREKGHLHGETGDIYGETVNDYVRRRRAIFSIFFLDIGIQYDSALYAEFVETFGDR